jgi:hypothetical protein
METVRVSGDGGIRPAWSVDGSELFYEDGEGYLVSAKFRGGETVTIAGSERLFRVDGNSYSVSPDGRILVNRYSRDQVAPPLTVLVNWDELLRSPVSREKIE